MSIIGKLNTLEIVKEHDAGVYLDGGPFGEILLPNRYVTDQCKIGETVDVFIYFDSEDRIVASTEMPLVMVDEFAFLKVVSTTSFGAFLDWGLPKDLLLPFKEQRLPVEEGSSYVVYVYVDDRTNRIVATTKVDRYLNLETPEFNSGDKVDLLIYGRTELGYKAIINNAFSGIIYSNEVFKPIKIGQKTEGYIKKVRPDGKIDLSLEPLGYQKVDPLTEELLEIIKKEGGFLPLNDNSDPALIMEKLGMSKKTFKKAIGALYRQKFIALEEKGIRLII